MLLLLLLGCLPDDEDPFRESFKDEFVILLLSQGKLSPLDFLPPSGLMSS